MQHSANIGVPPRALAKAPTGIQGLDEITNGEAIASDVASLGFDLPALVDEGKLFIDYVRIERSEIEEAWRDCLSGWITPSARPARSGSCSTPSSHCSAARAMPTSCAPSCGACSAG
jgi:hypothetical protein